MQYAHGSLHITVADMLCIECKSVLVDLRRDGTEALPRVIEVRTYSNVYAAQAAGAACSFCNLVWDAFKIVNTPDFLSYCRGKWAPEVYKEALKQNPLYVYHEQTSTADNIMICLEASVISLPGYVSGPVGFSSTERLGGFFVIESSPLANVITARPLVHKQSAESMTRLAKSWYQSCNTRHSMCAKQPPISQPGFRLVDLRNPFTLYVCEGLSRVDQYAALSYRWGDQAPLKLTTSTLTQFSTRGLLLKDLPATIKDACHLCQSLEIPFLWVDCLCIIQDSVSDWNQQAIRMGTVFSQAALVIRAAAGPDCTHGLFQPRKLASDAVSELSCIAPDGRSGVCLVRGALLRSQYEPLDNRSWALQEYILSHRALTFGKAEMSWDCAQHRSESGFQPMTDVRAKYLQMQRGPFYHKDKQQISFLFWKLLLMDYARRDLTLARDKLPAIAGLAWWFAKRSGISWTDYIAGLWKPHLPQALLWFHSHVTGRDVSKPVRPKTPRAPSWSWAAWDFPFLKWKVASSDPAFAEVLDSTMARRLVGQGEEVQGIITLRGLLRRGWLLPNYHYPEFYTLWDDDWREDSQKRGLDVADDAVASGNAFLDSFDLLGGTEDRGTTGGEAVSVQCLRITRSWCLLVEKAAEDGELKESWTRIGVAQMHEGCVATWWNDAERCTLTIA